ncbi:hypothetical protein AB1Y20_002441 [Prymnesium parvum]|uniref:Ubiquitin-like domain-containing protein n=1 Tax=Prymnesium parvum TaxID=97485 RepID=A0AB34JAN2_PRYPA
MPRSVLLLAVLPLVAAFAPGALPASAATRFSSPVTMAHHVQKKATKGHQAYRPRKSRPSDRNRTPPSYPAIPDVPWMLPIDSLTGPKVTTVSIAVEATDTAESLKGKLTAAGAEAPEKVFFGGAELTGSLGDAGLAEGKSLAANVYSKA